VSATIQPSKLTALSPRPPHTTREWLDALCAGSCDQSTFFRAVSALLEQSSEDAGWELLSLVDQYYRRGKLSSDSYRSLKSQLQGALLGQDHALSDSLPAVPNPTTAVRSGAPQVPSAPRTKPPAAAAAREPPEPTRKSAPAGDVPRPPAAAAAREPPESTRKSAQALIAGDVLRDRYRLQGLLASGATGLVYEAIDLSCLDLPGGGQKVAIKVLRARVIQSPQMLGLVHRQFQCLRSLSHPNIVRVHDYDHDGDIAFITMEFLSGSTLSHILSAHSAMAMERSHALTIIRCLGSALAYAHGRGVLHGDLNPGNIFITAEGEIRVLDFGGARDSGPWIAETEQPRHIAAPSYASCQLLEGAPTTARDDVYALSCLAYILLTGKHPFQSLTSTEARAKRLRPRRPAGLSSRQWQALRSGLSFDQARRPADIQEWLRRLNLPAQTVFPRLPGLLTAQPQPPRHAITAAIGLALALTLAGGWWALAHHDSMPASAASLRTAIGPALDRGAGVFTQLWDDTRKLLRIAPSNPPPAIHATQVPAAEIVTAQTPAQAPPPVAAASAHPETHTPAPRPPAPRAASAPVPRAKLELAAEIVDISPVESVASVMVRRSGNLSGDVSFKWWTESGTAKPKRDFSPVWGRVEHIVSGKAAVALLIPVVADTARKQARNFYVVIDDASPGSILGRTLTMVALQPAD